MPYGGDPVTEQPPKQGGYGKDAPAAAPRERQEPPSALGSFFRSLVYGGTQAMLGAEQFGFGLAGDTKTRDLLGQKSAELRQAFQRSPEMTRHPAAAGIGEFAGSALPFSLLGAAGRPASALGNIVAGGARGAIGGAAQPVETGDYWDQKKQQLMVGGAAGAAIPAVGGMIAPRLPSMQNPMLYGEGLKRAFRPLFNFVMGAEEKTVDGFDRTIARQALDPIGESVPGNLKGHGLLNHTYDKLSDAYDRLLPNISLPVRMWRAPPPDVQNAAARLSQDDQRRLQRTLQDEFWGRFNPNTLAMDGRTFKNMESKLSTIARGWIKNDKSNELGRVMRGYLEHFRDLLTLANPNQAPELQKINESYRMFAMMREASDASEHGRFSPRQLIREIESGQHDAWKGKDPMLRYAQVGLAAVDRKLSPQQLMHLATRHGAIAETIRGTLGPTGRAMKGVAPYASGPAGAYGASWSRGDTQKRREERMRQSYNANRRGDLDEVQRLAKQQRRQSTLTIAPGT